MLGAGDVGGWGCWGLGILRTGKGEQGCDDGEWFVKWYDF